MLDVPCPANNARSVRSGRSGDESERSKRQVHFLSAFPLSWLIFRSVVGVVRCFPHLHPKGGLHHTAQSVLLPTHSHTVSSTALIPHLGRCRLPINRRCWMDAALAHTAQLYAVGPIFPNNLHPVRNITSSGARRKSAGRSQEFCYHKNTHRHT